MSLRKEVFPEAHGMCTDTRWHARVPSGMSTRLHLHI